MRTLLSFNSYVWIRAVIVVTLLLALPMAGTLQATRTARAGPLVLQVDRLDDVNDAGAQVCSAASNDCSLRGAISKTNLETQTAFEISLPAGHYVLTLAGTDEDMNESGDLDVRGNILLRGAGATITTIDANRLDRVIHVLDGATVTIDSVTLTGGQINGHGGGLLNARTATVSIVNSVVSGNRIEYPPAPNTGCGGGLYNAGVMTVRNTHVVDNSIRSSDENYDNMGGGVYNHNGATIRLQDCQIDDNMTAGLKSHGAGIRNLGALTMLRCTVSDNRCENCAGGGILSTEPGRMVIAESAITNNFAGGIGSGAGVFSGYHSSMIMINSTVSGNQTPANGAGINGGSENNLIILINNTITDNHAEGSGGGIYNDLDGVFVLRNNIIAGNSASSGDDCRNYSSAATIVSLGHNIIGKTDGCLMTMQTTDMVGVDPLLEPLTMNQPGMTPTHALNAASPARDAVPLTACVDQFGERLFKDQRGVVRPQGDSCDIGAYEYETESTRSEHYLPFVQGGQFP